jgi:hypothetical protein
MVINPNDYIFDGKYIIFNEKINDIEFIDKWFTEYHINRFNDEEDRENFKNAYSKLKPFHKYEIDEVGDWTDELNCYLEIISGPITRKNGTTSVPVQRIVDSLYYGFSQVIIRIDLFCFKGYTDLRDNKILNIIT